MSCCFLHENQDMDEIVQETCESANALMYLHRTMRVTRSCRHGLCTHLVACIHAVEYLRAYSGAGTDTDGDEHVKRVQGQPDVAGRCGIASTSTSTLTECRASLMSRGAAPELCQQLHELRGMHGHFSRRTARSDQPHTCPSRIWLRLYSFACGLITKLGGARL